FWDLPQFHRATADEILTAFAWDELNADLKGAVAETSSDGGRLVLFTAHSLPVVDSERSRYAAQIHAAASAILELIFSAPAFGGSLGKGGGTPIAPGDVLRRKISFDPGASADSAGTFSANIRAKLSENGLDAAIAFQSRSGLPTTPWLEPDVATFVRRYKEENPTWKRLIVAPIGFFFENMETVCDLDVELRAVCEALGVGYVRAKCCGGSERMAKALCDLARSCSPDDFPPCFCASNECDFSCRLAK
ncbi:MAG: ferrochelatase, partial [Thermoguttaceae bacterium]|nr:ferrochelatase [Thermoguttaceae bacterium]